MTCAQGLLRLLWGGAEVGVLRHWVRLAYFHDLLRPLSYVTNNLSVFAIAPFSLVERRGDKVFGASNFQ